MQYFKDSRPEPSDVQRMKKRSIRIYQINQLLRISLVGNVYPMSVISGGEHQNGNSTGFSGAYVSLQIETPNANGIGPRTHGVFLNPGNVLHLEGILKTWLDALPDCVMKSVEMYRNSDTGIQVLEPAWTQELTGSLNGRIKIMAVVTGTANGPVPALQMACEGTSGVIIQHQEVRNIYRLIRNVDFVVAAVTMSVAVESWNTRNDKVIPTSGPEHDEWSDPETENTLVTNRTRLMSEILNHIWQQLQNIKDHMGLISFARNYEKDVWYGDSDALPTESWNMWDAIILRNSESLFDAKADVYDRFKMLLDSSEL